MESAEAGYIYDFFTSIQGEGLWAGALHHFIRFSGCTWGCRFCDTPHAIPRSATYRMDGIPAGPNPMTAGQVLEILGAMDRVHPLAEAVSITGGEPLEQADFLLLLLPAVRKAWPENRPILLETAGLDPEAMGKVAPFVDLVSMDLKLSASGVDGAMEIHERFLEALSGTPFYTKAVVDRRTATDEVAKAAALVGTVDRNAPFFLQPAGGPGGCEGGAHLLRLWEEARKVLEFVRVLPQAHPVLRLR